MTSARQRQANQRNALQSTGPRTANGKRRASRNATTHGLLARDLLLDDEEAAELQALRDGLQNDLQPDGELEGALVERIVSALWRLRRCGRIEAGLLALERYEILAARRRGDARRQEIGLLDELIREDKRIVDEGAHRKAVALAEKAEASRDSDATVLAAAFRANTRQGDTISKLSRYETAIERALYRGLRELERLRELRRNPDAAAAPVPNVPKVIDVKAIDGAVDPE